MGLSYGDSGLGKTTDLVAAFGGPKTLVVCQPGGTTSATTFLKTPPLREKPIRRLERLLALFEAAAKHGYIMVLVDDLSLIAEDTTADLEAEYAGSRNKFAMWGDLRDTIVGIRRLSRWLNGIGVWYTAHEAAPVIDVATGAMLRGGPQLPSKKQVGTIPKQVEAVYRHTTMPARPGSNEAARGVYEVGVTPNMWGKDRYTTVPGTGPANLRAALVNGGFTLPRWPHLTWQDSVMFHTADSAMESGIADPLAAPPGEERAELWKQREAFARQIAQDTMSRGAAKAIKMEIAHVAWAIRDGLALAEYRKLNEERALLTMFGGNPYAGNSDDDDDDDDDDGLGAAGAPAAKGTETPELQDEAAERAAGRARRAAVDDDDL